MRSTRASAAVERLKVRSGESRYSMVRTGDELFYLVLKADASVPQRLCDGLALDDFVQFVNAYGPQTPRRATKADLAFEKQLVKK